MVTSLLRSPSFSLVDNKPPRLDLFEKVGAEAKIEISDKFGILPASVVVELENGLTFDVKNGLRRTRFGYSFDVPAEFSGDVHIFATDYAGNRMRQTRRIEGDPPDEYEDPGEYQDPDEFDQP
ncbi:MAG: hypothetical protein U5N86_11615 [Planctomycetota bacterium]|nr:hypothetical protein [Planctomycetota bacterium]